MRQTKLDYVCFTSCCGYAIAAKNYIKALINTGRYDVKITPLDLGFPKQHHPDDYEEFNQLTKKPFDPNSIQFFHCIPEMQRRFRDKRCNRSIAIATFETIDPPKHWLQILNANSAIIAPSQFIYDQFNRDGLKRPIFYVPHCINFDVFNPYVKPHVPRKPSLFRFMFFGSWKKRKGCHNLVQAFLEEFSADDDVKLIISGDTDNSMHTDIEKISNKFQGKKLPEIEIIDSVIPPDKVPAHLKSAECIVLPTLGEGFGLPGLQAMSLGTPLLITNYSGCRDYANEHTATLLQPEGFQDIDFLDGIPQFRNKKWVYISVSQLKLKLREVYSHYNDARQKAIRGMSFVLDRFSYRKSVELIEYVFSRMHWLST